MVDVRRTRSRKRSLRFDKQEIVNRVIRFFDNDDSDRSAEKEARIQRYAKYRMWTEGKDWPWENSSDIPLPDMAEKSLHLQDVLHNAVMSSRPVVNANAFEKVDSQKEDAINNLIDFQFFIEQQGEEIIGDLADAFINDGVFVGFIPWVKEMRNTSQVKTFDPIPDDLQPVDYFDFIIRIEFPGVPAQQVTRSQGWDWQIQQNNERLQVSFFTTKTNVEMVTNREMIVYDGPRVVQKEWDEVLYPSRAANLQAPSPSNPHGAGHVILVDYPSIDEIKRLAKDGIYDQLTKDDLDRLEVISTDPDNKEFRDQKDTIQGVTISSTANDRDATLQKTVTRLMCFDTFDINGDGLAEDVVWWVIKDTNTLARAMIMTEAYPSSPPRRPIVHKSFLPIRGRVTGISLLEMMEGLHDAAKVLIDQIIDSGTFKIAPPWFYRPSASVKPEIIQMSPGEGYPLSDPQRDVNFPQISTQGDSMGLNLFSIVTQMEERLTTIGDLQLGRVPSGRASALRTVGGMALVAGQGEARPERILRRFFSGLAEIWGHIHELNTFFLPEKKKIRVLGINSPSEDPYQEITKGDVIGRFKFDFKANVLNTSKLALQQSLQSLMGTYVSDLALQLGIINPDGIYRLFRQWGMSLGQDPDSFLTPPSPDSMRPRIMAEEAISTIMDTQIPDGIPAEGAQQHLQKLQVFFGGDNFGLLNPEQLQIFNTYLREVLERANLEQQELQIIQAAQQFQGVQQTQGQPGPQGIPQAPQGTPPVQPNELIDETLPGAGGGGAPGI